MTKEELKKEAEDWIGDYTSVPCSCMFLKYDYTNLVEAYLAGAEPREKRIVELEEKISILLSCKNCPNNKGGYICQKEYEDKCLAQKIQYINELKAYNEKLLDGDIEKHNKIVELEEENSRLKQIILGNEMEIAAKDETIEELKKQV